MIKKRTAILGTYNTAEYGWTLAEFKLSKAEQKLKYIEKVGGDGSIDVSTVLTDGIPRYKNRDLSITLECSQGNREHRQQMISHMINLLDGFEWPIVPPDHPDYFLTGRLHIEKKYSDLAHASVVVTGSVAPWLYKRRETVKEGTASIKPQNLLLRNEGRLAVVPRVAIDGNICITYGETVMQLPVGVYDLPSLLLTTGDHYITYSGEGTLRISYREGVLE